MFQHVKQRDDYKNGTICSLPMGRWTSTMDLGNLWTAQSVNQAEVQKCATSKTGRSEPAYCNTFRWNSNYSRLIKNFQNCF